jgi:hypothetical protein
MPPKLSGTRAQHGDGASRKKVEAAMREVHTDIPSTVERADVSGARKEKMLRAIAFSKARKGE